MKANVRILLNKYIDGKQVSFSMLEELIKVFG